MTDRLRLACSDVDDLAALYVLDALGADEAAEVVAHLADHAERHPSFAELAGVTPFLAESIPPVAPPPQLRDRVMGAVAATPQLARPVLLAAGPAPATAASPAVLPAAAVLAATDPAAVPVAATDPAAAPAAAPTWSPSPVTEWTPVPASGGDAPVSIDEARARRARRSPLRALLAAAAVLAIVVLGGWNVLLRQQNTDAQNRLALFTDAVAAAGQPGAVVTPMTGSDMAADAGGYAVFPPEGTGYIVLTGLPAAPADHTWQAWTIADAPVPAGLMTVGPDGLAVLGGVERMPGTSVVALTVEPAGGSDSPTTTPVVVGQLSAPLAWSEGLVALVP